MQNEQVNKVWNELLTKLRANTEIDPNQIDAFFARLHPQAVSDGFLMLTADNSFIKSFVESHYSVEMKKALKDLYGTDFTIMMEVDATEGVSLEPVTQVAQQPPVETAESVIVEEEPTSEPESEPTTEDKEGDDDDDDLSNMTFENFVIGSSNRMAYSMAVSVAEQPGKEMLNPLFIYGKSGLGKTHLMLAIRHYIRAQNPYMKVIYVDSIDFLNDYTEASLEHSHNKSSYKNFKSKYETADVLLIDDVQSLQGKVETLKILFQIFNSMKTKGRQIVMAADRQPAQIDIDERYRSRFNSGGTVDIQPPEVETKLGIVKSFIEDFKQVEDYPELEIPESSQMLIAEYSGSNIRELRSAITRIIMYMKVSDLDSINDAQTTSLLNEVIGPQSAETLTMEDIKDVVCGFYRVSKDAIAQKGRAKAISNARQVCMYIARETLNSMTYAEIGQCFNRDHATAIYAHNAIESKMEEDSNLREEVATIMQILKEQH